MFIQGNLISVRHPEVIITAYAAINDVFKMWDLDVLFIRLETLRYIFRCLYVNLNTPRAVII